MPQLQRIAFRNVRSFASQAWRDDLEIRPITLLYGHNNVGKSAALRVVAWLDDSLTHSGRQPLNLQSPSLLGASYPSLVTTGANGAMELEASLGDSGRQVHFKWSLRYIHEELSHVVEEFRVTSEELGTLCLKWQLSGSLYSGQAVSAASEPTAVWDGQVKFQGLLPQISKELEQPAWQTFLSQVEAGHRFLEPFVVWLSSNRSSCPRLIELSGPPIKLAPDGQGFAQWLAWPENENLLSKVSRWYEENLQLKLSVQSVSRLYELVFSPLEDPSRRINAADVGQGLQEMLPVLTALHMTTESLRNIVCIEEPESHLHPGLQASLADECVRAVNESSGVRMVMETHSEILLLSIQLAVAEKRLSKDHVALYWVDQSPSGASSLRRISVDEVGRITPKWPRNVYSHDAKLARRLFDLQGL